MGLENIVPGMPVERILREFQEAIMALENGGGGNVYDGIKTIKIFEPSVLWQGVGGTGETADYNLPLSRDLDINFKGFVRENIVETIIETEVGAIPGRITAAKCLGIVSMDILTELIEDFNGQENPDIVNIFELSNGDLTYFAFEFELYVETKPDEFNWVPVLVSYDFDFKFNFIIEGFGTNNMIINYNYSSGLIGEGELSHALILGEKESDDIIPRYTRMDIDEAGIITYLPLQFPFMDASAIVNESQASLGNLYMDENGFIKLKRP